MNSHAESSVGSLHLPSREAHGANDICYYFERHRNSNRQDANIVRTYLKDEVVILSDNF